MKRKHVVSLLGGPLMGCLLGSAAIGAEQPATGAENETRLDQIVVTATRTEKTVDTAPGSVSVVTKEEMDKRNITTVDEALNTTAGVITTRGKGPMDRMSAVTLRGIPGQSRTLVMMDGITMNNPYSGNFLWLGASPDNLERIEVVKGPFSSLYGGYAMGGAINMITRMPDKREITLKTGYGSGLGGSDAPENTRRVSASYGDSFQGKFRVFINNDYLGMDGYRSDAVVSTADPANPPIGVTGWSPTTTNTGARAWRIGDKGQNGTWQNNLTLKGEYSITPDSIIRFTFLKSTGEYSYDDPASYLRNASGAQTWSYGTGMAAPKEGTFLGGGGGSDQYLYNLGLETVLATTTVKLNLGYVDQVNSWNVTPTAASATRSGGPGTVSDTPAGAISTDLQATTPLFNRHLLTVGGSFRTGWATARDNSLTNWKDESSKGALTFESKGSDRTFALFAEDEIMLLDTLTAYVGFRQDWWETFDGYINRGTVSPVNYDSRSASSFSPKGALVYKPFELTTLRASVGRAFRAPTVYDLYRTTTMGGTVYAGNPGLNPETSTSWDISVEQRFRPADARVKATYFENYISDLIYSSATATAGVKNKFNAGKAESRGVELETEVKPASGLRLFANYTYTDAVIKENSAAPASVGKRMTDVPEHMFNVGSDLEYGPFGTFVVGRYVGKRYGNDDNSDTVKGVQNAYDPYFTLDLKLRYTLTSWATASFAVNNLLDEQYYSYAKAAGRSCFGEVTLKF